MSEQRSDCRALTWLVCTFAAASACAGEHPRLLMAAADLPRLRHVCGVAPADAAGPEFGKFASEAAHFNALRAHFAARDDSPPLPGELAAAAFMVCVAPDDPGARNWRALLNRALAEPQWITADPLEIVLALDWGWRAIDPEIRDALLLTLRQRAALLTPADSPLDHPTFRTKLATLAFAACVDGEDDRSETWTLLRRELTAAAEAYFSTTFPNFVAWRGRTPTTPAAAALEECDAALALECADVLLKSDHWAAQRNGIGRWLEHYVVAVGGHPALRGQFARDDAGHAPGLPLDYWSDMTPLTAFLIAARTGDGAARLVAARVEREIVARDAPLSAAAWRFVLMLFDLRMVKPCDAAALPPARNLDGAIVFRGGGGANDLIAWIEGGRPFLRDGQRFDAGHFLVRRGGELVVGGGECIAGEAVATKGGGQHIGTRFVPDGFEQFCAATISHNALLVWNSNRAAHWRGSPFEPGGGQRPQQGVCTDFLSPLEGNPRHTGRLFAYGWNQDVAYAALDLSAAYDSRDVQGYTREFIFFWRRALVIVDRVSVAGRRAKPVVVVQLPARPTLDGAPLSAPDGAARSRDVGGVWPCASESWLRWTERQGGAWLTFLAPDDRDVQLVGGPAARETLKSGRFSGRSYVGGSAESFERLIRPIASERRENAWFRLGTPTALAESVGRVPHWGRVEASASAAGGVRVFVTVLITGAADDRETPRAALSDHGEDGVEIRLSHGDDVARFELNAGRAAGGRAQVGAAARAWPFPSEVDPDQPLPTETP